MIILASASPRRKELMRKEISSSFVVIVPHIDESLSFKKFTDVKDIVKDRADKYSRPTGISASAGIPATHHIKAGMPAMKMTKPNKYPRICFIMYKNRTPFQDKQIFARCPSLNVRIVRYCTAICFTGFGFSIFANLGR